MVDYIHVQERTATAIRWPHAFLDLILSASSAIPLRSQRLMLFDRRVRRELPQKTLRNS